MELQIRGLKFSYRSKPILDKINMNLQTGDFLSLVGPNGSGKSTLLRCVDGILNPQCGSILIDGRNMTLLSQNELARDIGYVPQSEGHGTSANVFETVLMGRKPYISWTPTEYDLQRTATVIKQLGLEDLALQNIACLSGGQRQKAFIGRAFAQETPVLLLDEPTANLDLKHQLEVLELLKFQTGQGVSVIVAIHDLNLASRYSNKIIMLRQGTIYAAGGPEVLNQSNIEAVYEVKVRIINDQGFRIVIPEGGLDERVS